MSSTETAFVCPECDKEFTRADNLANHREKVHGVEKPPSGRTQRQPRGSKTQGDLARAHLGASIMIVTVSNAGVLANTQAVDLLEKQSNDWAAAAYAIARQDQRIMNAIDSAMRAGVWAAFMAQTAGSVLTVAAMSGKVAVPYGAAVFLVPELAAMMSTEPPPGPGANGNGTHTPPTEP